MNIPYGKQDIDDSDLEAVISTLKSDWLTQGPLVGDFEKAISKKCGAQYACATNSATSALHIACLALGLRKGDTLWTSPNTFVASANCAIYCNAKVDFVDIDPATFNICTNALEKKLIEAERENNLPKAIVPVHFGGLSCDMEHIYRLSEKYGFKIIEDASHAIGSTYKDYPVGSCKFSDITIFSFHPVKIITTGEGGMALTNNEELASRLESFRTHGITRDSQSMIGESEGPWFYQQINLGFNYRITDIQAALGLSQHKRLDEFVKRRNELAKRYKKEFQNLEIRFQEVSTDNVSAYHLFVINLLNAEDIKNRKNIFTSLRDAGIGANVHYIPVHYHPFYKSLGFSKGDFPISEKYYDSAISLPMFPGLKEEDQDFVIENIKNLIN